jgi:heme O synthase-like polyprenyltransferase
LLTVPVTLLPTWLGYLSLTYGLVALVLGVAFTWSVIHSLRVQRPTWDYRVFKHSIVYLTILFLVMLVDLALQGAHWT